MLVTEERPLDAAGRPRSPATMPGYHAGRPPRNKGPYPADPPRVEEIVAVMRQAGPGIHGARLRGLIVVLWRAGLRISETLSLAEGLPSGVERVEYEINLDSCPDAMIATTPVEFEPPAPGS